MTDAFVSVEVEAEQASEQAEELFTQSLSRELETLVADLGLPLRPSVVVRSSGVSNEVRPRLTIDGAECPMGVVYLRDAEERHRSLARIVARSAFAARHRFVSTSVCEVVRDRWWSEGVPREVVPSVEAVRHILVDLVRRCIRIDRIRGEVLASSGPVASGWTLWRTLELAAPGMEAPRVQLLLGRDQYSRSPSPEYDARAAWTSIAVSFQRQLYDELGVLLPSCEAAADLQLGDSELRVQINDLRFPAVAGPLEGEFWANESPSSLAEFGVRGRASLDPTCTVEGSFVVSNDAALERCRASGLIVVDRLQFGAIMLATTASNAAALLAVETVRYGLEKLEEVFPSLVEAVLQNFELADVTRILRTLLDQGISVRDLRSVLEDLLAIDGTATEPAGDRAIFLTSTRPRLLAPGRTDNDLPYEYGRSLARTLHHYRED